MAAINLTVRYALIAMVFLFGCGCSRGGGTIRHGNLSYKAENVFSAEPSTLKLAKAAGRGDVAEITRLISDGAKVNTFGENEITPLWWAAWARNFDGFNALLEKGGDPNAQRSAGLPLMHLVAQIPDVRFLAAALKHGGNPNTVDQMSGVTPLYNTVTFHLEEHTTLLLASGANINVQLPLSGWTLLMQAIGSNGDYKLVYQLLQKGADYTLKTKEGKTLADVVRTRAIAPNSDQYIWREKVLEYLRSKGVKVDRPLSETPRANPAN
jgi:ankyrin repeat protein